MAAAIRSAVSTVMVDLPRSQSEMFGAGTPDFSETARMVAARISGSS